MPTPRQYTNDAEKMKAYRQRKKAAIAEQLAAKNLPTTSVIPTMPSAARWKALHEQARAALETIIAEMEAYQSERTDKWQESDKGEEFAEKLNDIQDAFDSVDAVSL